MTSKRSIFFMNVFGIYCILTGAHLTAAARVNRLEEHLKSAACSQHTVKRPFKDIEHARLHFIHSGNYSLHAFLINIGWINAANLMLTDDYLRLGLANRTAVLEFQAALGAKSEALFIQAYSKISASRRNSHLNMHSRL